MFTAEVDLAAPVVAWLQSRGATCIAHEVDMGAGIPDLVVGIGSPQRLRNRRRQTGPIPDAVQLALLDFCQTVRSEAEIRAWAPHGYAYLEKRALLPLRARGLLGTTQKGIRARKNPRDPFASITAVELKLSASERGFAQAFSYRLFADVSYFAIPARKVTASGMGRARELGVGLLAVHERGCDEAVEPSTTRLATPGRRRIASERVLEVSARTDGRVAGSPLRNLANA